MTDPSGGREWPYRPTTEPIFPGTVQFDEHVAEAIRLLAWERCGVELSATAAPAELVEQLYHAGRDDE